MSRKGCFRSEPYVRLMQLGRVIINHMLSNEKLLEVVNSVQFLDWGFQIFQHGHPIDEYYKLRDQEPIEIRIISKSPDNFDRNKTMLVTGRHQVSWPYDEAQLVLILWNIVELRLKHEAGELFVVAGKRPFNEHLRENSQPHGVSLLKSMFNL